jgi:glutamate racemase
MDNRPIGFFDSGLGGLTCIPYMMDLLPKERMIYFGDTARTPYGSKSVQTIKMFAQQIADFLVENQAKMIVIACNTVSATCLPELKKRFPFVPILGIIEPAALHTAKMSTIENKVGVIGTKVTIESQVYPRLINHHNGKVSVHQKPCPALVPLIEEGIVHHDIMNMTIHYYLDDFILENRIDTLVLGCTHYPLIRGEIERIYPNLRIIDPSEIMAYKVEKTLVEYDLLSEDLEKESVFYASDLSENFINMIDRIFAGTGAAVEFKNLELDQYT